MKRIYFIFLFVFLSKIIFSQGHKEYYFKFNITNKSEIEKLDNYISIDNIKDNTVYAFATENNFQKFVSFGYDFILLNTNSQYQRSAAVTTIEEMQNWDKYPTYDLYVEMMEYYADTYPEICKLLNIGTTVLGRDLLVLKISDNINEEENEPEIFLSSTMHGDETLGYILMLRLIDSLVTNYSTNADISSIINSIEIYINPNANPDGTYQDNNNTIDAPQRFNANGIDINRNFPDPKDGNHPDDNAWQPETEAMMKFANNHSFVLSANFHCGAEVVNYPWDTWFRRHPDDEWFINISRNYADLAHANSPSGYLTDFENGITNGYDWYTITGGRQDYFTYFHNSREVTIELSDIHHVNEETLPDYWNYNKHSFLNFIKESLNGIKGLVTDSIGNPLKAMIYVKNHDTNEDSSMVFTDPEIGDYHRLIEPGTYDLIASAVGYKNDTIDNIIVNSETPAIANFILYPGENPTTNIKEEIYPNPFIDELNISVYSTKYQKIEINIFKITGERIYYNRIPINRGNTILRLNDRINLVELPSGIYYVQIRTSDKNISYSIVKMK